MALPTPPKLLPPALSHAIGHLLVVKMGIPPRSAALLQFALALRGRLDDMRTALSARNEDAMAALRLAPSEAAALREPCAAGNVGEAREAERISAAKSARRASVSELERNALIQMGMDRGYARYARSVPGQVIDFTSLVPRGDTAGPPITDDQLEELLDKVEAGVVRRGAEFASLVTDALEKLRNAPDVDVLKAQAKAEVEQMVEAARKKAEWAGKKASY